MEFKYAVLVTAATLIFFGMFFAVIMHYNSLEADRSASCASAGGSYESGTCEIDR